MLRPTTSWVMRVITLEDSPRNTTSGFLRRGDVAASRTITQRFGGRRRGAGGAGRAPTLQWPLAASSMALGEETLREKKRSEKRPCCVST